MSTVTNLGSSSAPSSGGSYILPTASTTILGGVKVDGTTITITGGVISSVSSGSGTVSSVGLSAPTGLSVSGSPVTGAGTLVLSYTAGYSIPTTSDQANWATAYTDRIASLTTSGTSGAATLSGNVLNIPQYAGATYTAGTGLTLSGGAFSVNASQTQITALGTIATGVWNGTAIADSYISSAATWNAKQAALGFTPENVANKATNFTTINNTLYPTVQAVNNAITSATVGLLDYRGSYDASGNTYPSSGGSGLAGVINKGDFWICSVAGTLNSTPVKPGDLIIALVDLPGSTTTNWDLIAHDSDLSIYALKTTTVNGHALSANVTVTASDLSLATVASTGAYSDLSGTPTAYSLPTASTSVLGGVKVDGTSIVISGGVISSAGGGGGTVTSVTSANANATIASTTTTPVITIVSAPKLATARNIAGVAFDGTANISLNNNAITNGAGYTTSAGSVTSVGLTTPTGLTTTGSPVTSSGTLAVTYTSGYQGYTTTEATKLSGIAAGATANSTDAYLLARANQTGTQTASTISDFSTATAATASVTTNTAKITNATHTGDATGATALTLATVNSNVGSFTNANLTVNAKGLITAASNGSGGGGGGFTWNNVAGASQSAAINNGYIANYASLCTITLPSTAAVGSVVQIAGAGVGGWKLAQNASQVVNFGNHPTTSGTGGSLASTNQFDGVQVICVTANSTWVAISSVGNLVVT